MTQTNMHFDVVIVGSGVAGALIAKRLGEQGKSVLILEAGEGIPANANQSMSRFYKAKDKLPESPYAPRIFAGQFGDEPINPSRINVGRPDSLGTATDRWNDPAKSYFVQAGPHAFASTYERMAGGTSHWMGTCLRFLPNDLRMGDRYATAGMGMGNWPLSYGDLRDFYDQAELELGVSGDAKEHSDDLKVPELFAPDYEYPMPGIPKTLVDQYIAARLDDPAHKVLVDETRLAVSSTPAARNSRAFRNRRACAGNSNCIPICPIQAKYDPTITLNEALETKHVTIWFRTVATRINTGHRGTRAVQSISYKTYATEQGPSTGSGEVTANVYVVAGNAIETPRLLLMSRHDRYAPNGVANSSDMVGRNLMDHPYYVVWGVLPAPVWPYRGPLITSGIDTARDGAFRATRGAFRIDIGNEATFPAGDPTTTTVDLVNGTNKGGNNPGLDTLFGRDLVKALNQVFTRQFRLGFLIEQTPDPCNRVTLSYEHTDGLGLPRPKIHYDLSAYTLAGLSEARRTAKRIFAAVGAPRMNEFPAPEGDPCVVNVEDSGDGVRKIRYFGAGHIVGTYRMGTSRENSVVNADLRTWDHPNLYLVGSGVFPTIGTANPTLTIAALSLRAADHILKAELA